MLIIKISVAIAGFIFLGLGIQSLISGATYREVKMHEWVGYFLIPFGLMLLFAAFKMKDEKTGDEASICPRCGTPFPEELEGTPCPKCGAALENMEGFYERHPEMRSETMKGEYEAQDK